MPEQLPTNDGSPDSEVVARRALGIALNRLWSTDQEERSIGSIDGPTANAAIAILFDRVPPGPQRERAAEIIRSSARPAAQPTA